MYRLCLNIILPLTKHCLVPVGSRNGFELDLVIEHK